MRCRAVQRRLALYRALDGAARAEVDAHVTQCAACRAVQQEFERQDAVLGDLPVVSPGPAWAEAVRARTIGAGHGAAGRCWRWVPAAALALAVFLGLSAGTIAAAGRALPGDRLYPVKRTVEEVRLSVMRDDATRDRFLETLRVRRLEEARTVAALGRDVVVEFEGIYEGASAGEWRLGAVRVLVPEGVWSGQEPSVGSAVRVRAHAAGGALKASEVRVQGPLLANGEASPATSGGGQAPDAAGPAPAAAVTAPFDAQPTVPQGATSDGTRPAAPGARPEPGGPGRGTTGGVATPSGAPTATSLPAVASTPAPLLPTAEPTSADPSYAERSEDRPGGGPDVGIGGEGTAPEPATSATETPGALQRGQGPPAGGGGRER